MLNWIRNGLNLAGVVLNSFIFPIQLPKSIDAFYTNTAELKVTQLCCLLPILYPLNTTLMLLFSSPRSMRLSPLPSSSVSSLSLSLQAKWCGQPSPTHRTCGSEACPDIKAYHLPWTKKDILNRLHFHEFGFFFSNLLRLFNTIYVSSLFVSIQINSYFPLIHQEKWSTDRFHRNTPLGFFFPGNK